MKRTTMLMLVLVIAAAAASMYTLSTRNTTPANTSASNMVDTKKSTPASNQVSSAKSTPQQLPNGQYIAYNPNVIAETTGTKILFFHATWCRQCQLIDADIKSQGVPDGVSVIKVDYDSNNELRKKYEITLQTTFVKIDNNGELIEKYVAYREPNFDSVRRELL